MFKIFATLMLVVGLTACGTRVEVPPAHVGKIMTKDGYREGVIGTSKFRLEPCISYCDKLVLLPVADQASIENMEIFMPQDKLTLKVSIRTNLTITDQKQIDALFNSLPPAAGEGAIWFYSECLTYFQNGAVGYWGSYNGTVSPDWGKAIARYKTPDITDEEFFAAVTKAYNVEFNGDLPDFLSRRWEIQKTTCMSFIEETLEFLQKELDSRNQSVIISDMNIAYVHPMTTTAVKKY